MCFCYLTFRTWAGEGSLVNFVVGLNLHRRHLTPSQKAAVALDILPMIEAEAKERQKASGGDRKSDEYKESVVPRVEQPVEHTRSIDQAAKIVGVNKQYVQDMKTIAREAPEKVEQIKRGEVTVKEAMREVRPAECIPAASSNLFSLDRF